MFLIDIQIQILSDCDCFVCVISIYGGEDFGFYVNFFQELGFIKIEYYVLNNKGVLWI